MLCLVVACMDRSYARSHASLRDTVSVHGAVLDSAHVPVPFATAVLLSPADSALRAHAITDSNGEFHFTGIAPAAWLLQITYIGYETVIKRVVIPAGIDNTDLGAIILHRKEYRLGEVKVEGVKAPFIFKEDTVEYHTGGIKTRPNAVAEDLLKNLPGVDVEPDGTVKAQGEDVKKVLVDGKEFFGNDPKAALKNLPADAIENVQVFDDSDEEDRSGDPQKTLNFVLKKDKKEGRFGKASSGYGAGRKGLSGGEGRYDGYLNYNLFDKKKQFTALGTLNNINRKGFSQIESTTSLTGLSNLVGGGALGGVHHTAAGGFNFNRDFGKKTNLRSSYVVSHYRSTAERELTRRTFTGGTYFTTEERTRTENTEDQHRLDLKFDQDINPSQKIRLKGKLNAALKNASEAGEITNTGEDGIPANTSATALEDDIYNLSFDTRLEWKNEFPKKGRELKCEIEFARQDDRQDGLFNAYSGFYGADTSGSTVYIADGDTTDQEQLTKTLQNRYGVRIVLDEPLDSNMDVRFSYDFSSRVAGSVKDFYDLLAGSQEVVLNKQLSDEYMNRYLCHRGNMRLSLGNEKSRWDFETGAQQASLIGDLITSGGTVRRDFMNILPGVRWKYTFSKHRKIRFRYYTRLREPSVQQLQPATDNREPFRLYKGNPALKAEYGHYGRLSYISIHPGSFRNYVITLSGGYLLNRIANRVTVDTSYVQTTEPVNVNNDANMRGYFSLHLPVKTLGVKLNLRSDASWNRYHVFINAVENLADRYAMSIGGHVENMEKSRFDVRAGVQANKSFSYYSAGSDFDNDYLSLVWTLDMEADFFRSWTAGSLFTYNTWSGSAFGEGGTLPLWSASLSKYFLRDHKGELRLIVFDILNQNRIVGRTTDLNYYEDEDGTTLDRFWMVSFIYNLAKS